MAETEYPKTFRSTVNRLKDRATYDQDKIHTLVNSAPVLHVSFLPTNVEDDPFPTILPMLGGFATFNPPDATENAAPALYLHGHISSRLFKLCTPGSGRAQWEEDGLPGIPVCVSATHIDGVVLALTPFNHSTNYRSAVIHGYASLVTDLAEKNFALHFITDNIVPERWDNSRVPPTEAELISTGVVRVDVVSASAKSRAYTTGNNASDLEDKQLVSRVWNGVIPSYMKYGEPVPAITNLVQEVPQYLSRWIEESNRQGEEYSREVASRPKP